MSTDTITDQTTAETTANEAPAEETLNEGGVKALRAERDARKAADARVKDLEAQVAALSVSLDEAKTAGTVATEQAAAQVAELQAKLARAEVIHTMRVPDALADFLQGSNTEELTASAEKLLAAIPAPAPAPASDASPAPLAMRPDPSQGGTPEPATTTDALTAMLIGAVGGR
ncbi:hypothetical protein [uncultured Actinomyces sp.]|uniref:hypothetical protein n=1 Tax=uncultured Actinomyces sp. TaxID=249061 RepID=UPI0028EC2049|nr:hypothetical protein [uncultured Actinomyces sp.]